MATYSITTTAQTVAPSGNTWWVTHTSGTANVFLAHASGRTEVLRPGGEVSLVDSWTARTTAGTATIDVSSYDPAWVGLDDDGGVL